MYFKVNFIPHKAQRKMNPQVSIIVPMHNSASTIVRCVDSILSQVGCKSLEIILVDDGSADSTILTVEEAYGILFGNSRTFHYQDYDVRLCFTGYKDCHGVSFARNSGIKKASGQWLTFVDSDDFIGENHIANLLNCAVKNNADIAWSGYSNFDVATEENHKSEIIFDDNEVLDSEKYKKYFFTWVDGLASVWNKLYKTDIIKKSGITFKVERRHGEDWYFNLQLSQFVSKIAVTKTHEYFYCKRPTSSSATYKSEDIESMIESVKILQDFKNQNSLEVNKIDFENTITWNFAVNLTRLIANESDPKHHLEKVLSEPIVHDILTWHYPSTLPLKYKLPWILLRHGKISLAISFVKTAIKFRK